MSRAKKMFMLFVLVLALIMAFPLYPAKADSSGICFTAVNDKVLSVSLMPVYVGGSLYVNCEVFRVFGISSNYFASENALQMVCGGKQLIFYLNDGTCVDGDNVPYPISATSMNGAVYVPARTGRFFGLTDTLITGTGNGDLIRIKDGTQVLNDSQFLDAASNLVLSLYQEYTKASGIGSGDQTGSENSDADGTESPFDNVYLSFIGMPSSEMLDELKNNSACAAFFITADQARENPDTVRRIIGEGSTVGILCETELEAECKDAINAIQEAAFYIPTIITSLASDTEECEQFAEGNGLVYYSPGITLPEEKLTAYQITSKLTGSWQCNNFCLFSGEKANEVLPSVLQYITSKGFSASALSETANLMS